MGTQISKISLDGITLEMMVIHLVEIFGWAELGEKITINCFLKDPSIKSSLTFLRKTPWARKKVENLYLKLRKAQLVKKAKTARAPASPGKKTEPIPSETDPIKQDGPWSQAEKRRGKC